MYGGCIEAYTTVTELLESGVPPDSIMLLQPTRPTHWPTDTVRERVTTILTSTGVHTLTELRLTEWLVGEDGLYGVNIETSTGDAQTVPCCTMIYLEDKAVDRHVFKGMCGVCDVCMVCLCDSGDCV